MKVPEIVVNLLVAELNRGLVVILRQLADRPHVDRLAAGRQPLRLQEVDELVSECCHRTSLLVEKRYLDKKLDRSYESPLSKHGKLKREKSPGKAHHASPCREAAMFNKAMHLTCARAAVSA
jgi:hypothetical protein